MMRWLDKNPRTSDVVAGVQAAGERCPWSESERGNKQSADEQLTNLQKRIFLIEFLRLGLFIVYQEKHI